MNSAPPASSQLSIIALLYGVKPALLHPLSGGHTAQVYDFPYMGKFGVLRILKPGLDIDLASMQAVQAWLTYLAVCGGPVSPPIPSIHGRTLEQVEVDGQEYLVEAGEMASGVLAEELPQEQWSEALFHSLGQAVGLYHRIAMHYQLRRPELRRPEWRANLNCFNPSADELAQASPAVLAKRQQTLARLEHLPRDEESWGLAHLDLHFGNFYVDAEKN
ncbi:MAG: phosphotransferase [Anaerolineales bacterium]|nr:phosphotransferase [Anaerolineales bacterium]